MLFLAYRAVNEGSFAMIRPRISVIFGMGFRPFFTLATGFAVIAIVLWMAMLSGHWQHSGPLSQVDWHVHEMLFGYTSAVLTGFLLTAVPNWTGLPPIKGWPLGLGAAHWIAGRLVMLGLWELPDLIVMVIDTSFLAVVSVSVAIQLIVSGNWRNLVVIGLVGLLLIADVAFHIEVMSFGIADYSRRAGFAVILMLIILIGGRIIPSFTRNWLVKQKATSLPAPFGRIDILTLAVSFVALAMWVAQSNPRATAVALGLASMCHLIRLLGWKPLRVRRSAILLMLHAAYLCLPVGLILLALATRDPGLSLASGLHILGMGAIGGMTAAVMMRASLGHTGRRLAAGPILTVAITLIFGAALIRAALPFATLAGLTGVQFASCLWIVGFGLICMRMWPWLLGLAPASFPGSAE
ncbi:NnrS family protein [Roseobacter sp. EG26]|uniref:NnrS family protein n=1 Tax=Roseobacter sp. EG26 TaxID=3412477 RepID=UPI003CE588F8